MGAPSQLRLLIADASQNRAHELDSLLRDAAIWTRPQFCTELDTALAILGEEPVDLMLCDAGFDGLETRLSELREQQPDLPVILLEPQSALARLSRGMTLGASDVVFDDDRARLLQVIQRELHHIEQKHNLLQTRRALEEAERRCRLLLASSSAAIAYVHEGMHIYANDDYLALFGFDSLDDLLGLPLLDLIDSDSSSEFKMQMKSFREAGETRFPFAGRSVAGELIRGTLSMAPAEYEGEPCTQVLVQPEASFNGHAMEPASQAPENVPPTGVEAFAKRLTAESDATSLAALLAVSIDDFDALQARLGLRVAHRLAEQLGQRLQEAASDSTIMRIGDDLYGVALHSVSETGAAIAAERMHSAIAESVFEIDGTALRATVTIGAIIPSAPTASLTALDLAFRTLTRGRADGGSNRLHWYEPAGEADPDASTEASTQPSAAAEGEKRRMLEQINEAIDNDRFLLLFQPIISLRSDSDQHYEVFLRMLDKHDEEVLPDQFLQIAVDHGAAVKIDRWVILQSIKRLSAHRAKGKDTRLTVNLTSNSLHDSEFAQWLSVAIRAARLPSDAIVFQFTEGDAACFTEEAAVFVEGLRSLHCRSSLSHFRGSKEAFEMLERVNVDFVKLNGALVRNVDQDRARRAQLAEVLQQLQGLGKLTVIPMVESATELSVLWQAGANYIQGYYLQEPSREMNYEFASDD